MNDAAYKMLFVKMCHMQCSVLKTVKKT